MVTVISGTIRYAISGIYRCPWRSVALARSGSSHDVVLGGALLVAKLGVLAVLAVMIVSHSKAVRPAIILFGFASVWIVLVWIVSIIVVVIVVFVGSVLVLA
jgi:hypothetical protein